MIIWTIGLSVISAFLYRIGGCSKESAKEKFPWFPQALVNTKARDIGVALVTVAWLLLCYPKLPWYIYLVTFGATFGALTTYWEALFGYDNFFFHGFMIGVAKVGCAIITGKWLGFGIHSVVLALAMGVVSMIIVSWADDDDFEEFGRGALAILTMPIMFL